MGRCGREREREDGDERGEADEPHAGGQPSRTLSRPTSSSSISTLPNLARPTESRPTLSRPIAKAPIAVAPTASAAIAIGARAEGPTACAATA